MTGRLAVLRVVLALLVLNGLLTFGNRWPSAWPQPQWRLSVEVAALVLVLLLLSARRWPFSRLQPASPGAQPGQPPGSQRPAAGRRSARVQAALAALGSLWVVLHYLDVTVPALLGRPLNVYWDGQHLWQVVRMAAADGLPWRALALIAGTALASLMLYALVRLCLHALVRGLAARALRPALALACAAVLLAWGLGPRLDADVRRAFAPPVAAMLADQAALIARALSPARSARQLGAGPVFPAGLSALQGADVLIVFAEAYGAITLDNPDIARALDSSRQALQQALEASGRHAVSARVRSPTFGGASWLAHAALLTGLDMRDPDDYRLLLTTRRPTLVGHFARHGYRTVGWMPGLQRPWPEGAFYGFERRAGAVDIGYTGPAFGYWRIPDQASMAQLQTQEFGPLRPPAEPSASRPALSSADASTSVRPATAATTSVTTSVTASATSSPTPVAAPDDPAVQTAPRRPRFVVFPTVSTHAPFSPLPPYLEDWQRLLMAEGFDDEAVAGALQAPTSWTEPTPAYLASMRYQFRWLAAWLREHAPADVLIIVIGDHQPIGAVTGPDASWDVPVHVIGRNRELLARLQAAGFSAGLQAPVPAIGPMHALTQILLDAFAH